MKTIDLHGINREKAKQLLEETFQNAAEYGEAVIRIIHGQGKHSDQFPVLKSWVRHWLAARETPYSGSFKVYHGEEGSPYTAPNPGETIVVLAEDVNQPVYFWEEDEEEREARNNAKGMRADRLRKLRRNNYR